MAVLVLGNLALRACFALPRWWSIGDATQRESGGKRDGKNIEGLPAESFVEALEEDTRQTTYEDQGAEVESTSSWSLSGSPAQADADPESAPSEKEGSTES